MVEANNFVEDDEFVCAEEKMKFLLATNDQAMAPLSTFLGARTKNNSKILRMRALWLHRFFLHTKNDVSMLR